MAGTVKYSPGNEPVSIKEKLDIFFPKIEEAYPDKVIENINSEHRSWSTRASELAEMLGYENNTKFFAAYGYTLVGGHTKKRSNINAQVQINQEDYVFDNTNVLYKPGEEPERIKKRIDILLPKLSEAYPTKEIRGLSKEHKKWYETIGELRKLLGYENNKAFLAAYGFFLVDGNAEQKLDLNAVVEELKKRYESKPFVGSLKQLKEANPDIAANIQTLNNRSSKEFGKSCISYLLEIGVISSAVGRRPSTDPKKEILTFLKKWEENGEVLFSDINELNKKCDYFKMDSFKHWVKLVYGIPAKDYLMIAGVIKAQ